MLNQSQGGQGRDGTSADDAAGKTQPTLFEVASLTMRQALSSIFIAGASFAAGGEVQESHGGTCGCTGCLPPPRVSVEEVKKKEDESGEQ